MIITQGYPLWAVVVRPNGHVACEPVIAWRHEGGKPTPLTAAGEVEPAHLSSYLTSQTAVDRLIADYEVSLRLARYDQAAKDAAGGAEPVLPPANVRREQRAGEARF